MAGGSRIRAKRAGELLERSDELAALTAALAGVAAEGRGEAATAAVRDGLVGR